MSESTPGSTMADAVKSGGGGVLFFGILTLVLGILCMAAPLVTGVSIAILIGVLLLVGGVARMVWAFKADSLGQGILKFLVGGLTLVAGLVMLGSPLIGLASLTLLLAAYFVVDGIFEIVAAFQVRPESGWGWLLFGGIVSLLLGLMIWRQFPLSGAWAIGVLVGIKLIFAGMGMITVGSVVRGIGKAAATS